MIKYLVLICFFIVSPIFTLPADVPKDVEGTPFKAPERGGKFGGGQGGRGIKKTVAVNFTIPHKQVVYSCVKPEFLTKFKCLGADAVKPKVKISEVLMMDARKLPFSKDQFLHLVFMPTEEALKSKQALKFTHAYVQLSDTSHQFLGRVAEQVPCLALGNPHYKGVHNSLYTNPGIENIKIWECPGTEAMIANAEFKNLPSVPVLKFRTPVEAFYVNLKLSKPEADYIQDQNIVDRLNIIVFLVDSDKACHYFKISRVNGLDKADMKLDDRLPMNCHDQKPAFLDEERKLKEKFTMRPEEVDISFKNVIFPEDNSTAKLRTKEHFAVIPNEMFRKKLEKFNKDIYGVDYYDGGKGNGSAPAAAPAAGAGSAQAKPKPTEKPKEAKKP